MHVQIYLSKWVAFIFSFIFRSRSNVPNDLTKHSPSDLVPELFAWNNSDFLTYSFVDMKIESKTWVILLDDYPRCLFDGLCPDTTLLHQPNTCK